MSNRVSELSLLILGDPGVGKKALAKQSDLDMYDPTLDDTHIATVEVDGSPFVLNILCLGGESCTAVRELVIRSGDAFILAYSVTSRTSFSHVRALYNDIKVIREKMRVDSTSERHSSQSPHNSPVILVGTKIDLEAQREVSVEEGQMLAKSLSCPLIEISVWRNINVEKALHDVVRCFRQQNPPKEPEASTPSQPRKGLGRLLRLRKKNDDGSRCVVT